MESKTQRNQNVISAIRELRKALGLTQQQLAVALGLAVVTVARWETSRLPSVKEFMHLSTFAAENNLFGLARRFLVLTQSRHAFATEVAYDLFDEADVPQTFLDIELRKALVLILRNQHLPVLRDDWEQIRNAILKALYRLSAAAQAGDSVQGSPTQIKEMIDSVKRWATFNLSTGVEMARENVGPQPTEPDSPKDQPPGRPLKRSK